MSWYGKQRACASICSELKEGKVFVTLPSNSRISVVVKPKKSGSPEAKTRMGSS